MRILTVLNKSYADDPRPQREIRALAQGGHSVRVFCFADPDFSPPNLENVVFHQYPLMRKRSSRIRYALEYVGYLLWCLIGAVLLLVQWPYDVLQLFLMPEPLILVGLIPKLAGVRILLDWEDLSYEIYKTKYRPAQHDPIPVLIQVFERIIVALSDSIIFPNEAFVDALESRGIHVKNYTIVMNAADPKVFTFLSPTSPDRSVTRLLFTGTISERNGVHVMLEAFAAVERKMPNVTLTILGDSIDAGTACIDESTSHSPNIRCVGRVAHAEVAVYMRQADIGLIPTSDTPFTRINVPTRIFEFGVAGLPVICADLPGIRQYFGDDEVLFHKPDDPADLARCIQRMANNDELRRSLAEALHTRCKALSWDSFKMIYLNLVERLASERWAQSLNQDQRTSDN